MWPLLTLLEPQSRFGDKPLNLQVVCPQNGTAVLKGLRPHCRTWCVWGWRFLIYRRPPSDLVPGPSNINTAVTINSGLEVRRNSRPFIPFSKTPFWRLLTITPPISDVPVPSGRRVHMLYVHTSILFPKTYYSIRTFVVWCYIYAVFAMVLHLCVSPLLCVLSTCCWTREMASCVPRQNKRSQ